MCKSSPVLIDKLLAYCCILQRAADVLVLYVDAMPYLILSYLISLDSQGPSAVR